MSDKTVAPVDGLRPQPSAVPLPRGGSGGSVAGPALGLTREAPTEHQRMGYSGAYLGRRGVSLFKYDKMSGAATATMQFDVANAAVMPYQRAADLLHAIHESYGVARVEEGVLYTFDTALFLCAAINGTSVMTPTERITFFVVDPHTNEPSEFEWNAVYTLLGQDVRRFFRAFADEIYARCLWLLNTPHPAGSVLNDLRDDLRRVATERDISRHPECASDVMEYCTRLSPQQQLAVSVSKVNTIGKSTNVADGRNTAPVVQSLDQRGGGNGVGVGSRAQGGPTYYA